MMKENDAACAASEEVVNEGACGCCCENGCCSFEPAEEPAAESAADEKSARSTVIVDDETLEVVRTHVEKMLEMLGLSASVRAEANPGKVNLILSSEEAGRIIGRRGQNLESLQLLINRMMQKNNTEFPRIFIDIDGYSSGSKRADKFDGDDRREGRRDRRERGERRSDRRGGRDRGERRGNGGGIGREEELRQMAIDAAKEVRRWGESKQLPAMNAHDRRIIHVTLESFDDITTASIGDEPNKAVVISMK